MILELPKSQKKIARSVIEIGLMREFRTALEDFEKLIQEWKEKKLDDRDAYHKMYKAVESHDKHIARRYDGMRGSDYVPIMVCQIFDGVIAKDDILEFEPEVRENILKLVEMKKSF
jgi:hypothetical protein